MPAAFSACRKLFCILKLNCITDRPPVHHRLTKSSFSFTSVQLSAGSSPKTRSCQQQEAMKSPLQVQGLDSQVSPSTTPGVCPGVDLGMPVA